MTYVVDVGALIEVQDKDPRSAVLLALLARRQEPGRELAPPPAIADVLDLNSGEMIRFLLQPEGTA